MNDQIFLPQVAGASRSRSRISGEENLKLQIDCIWIDEVLGNKVEIHI